jgi:hypothetical protein
VNDLDGGSTNSAGTSATSTAASSSAGGSSAPTLVSFLQSWLTNLQSDLGTANSTSGTLVNTSA